MNCMRHSISRIRRGSLLALVFALELLQGHAAHAGSWSVVNLHPTAPGVAPNYSSVAIGVANGQAVGWATWIESGGTQGRPTIWTGTAASGALIDSRPGAANGFDGSQIVGSVDGRAAIWSQPGGAYTNLQPDGSPATSVSAAYQGTQVGLWNNDAVVWHGTAASMLDLNPSGSGYSSLNGIDGSGMVGYYQGTDGKQHAALWTGLTNTVVDLGPSGVHASFAIAISNGNIVGATRAGGGLTPDRAAFWSGTAASYIDLTPAGAGGADANAIVGNIIGGGVDGHAGIWFSPTPNSFFDLQQFLPSRFTNSGVLGLSVDSAGNITAVGFGYDPNYLYGNNIYAHQEAMMWVYTVPEPGSLLALAGGVMSLVGLIRRKPSKA